MEPSLNYHWLNFKTNLVQFRLSVSFYFFCLWIFLAMQVCWLRTEVSFIWSMNGYENISRALKVHPTCLKKAWTQNFMYTLSLCNILTQILFFLLDEHVHPTKLWPTVSTVTVFLWKCKMYSYITIFQWGYLAGIP